MINLISPTTFTTAMLVADTYDAANGSVDSIPKLTQVGGQSASIALEIQSTLGAFLLPRMTTTQRLALTPTNGMQVYDTTLNQMYSYEGGAWGSSGIGSLSQVVGSNNIILTPNPITESGTIGLNPVLTALTSIAVGNLSLAANTVTATNTNGGINLITNGTGRNLFTGTVSYAQGVTGFIDNVNNLSAGVSTYTMLPTDSAVLPDTTLGTVTLTLPAAPVTGQTYSVIDSKGNATTFPIFLDGNGFQVNAGNPNPSVRLPALAAGSEPRAIVITPNGKYTYVANFNDGTVTVITNSSTTAPSVLTTLTTGTNVSGNSSLLAISPNGNYVYVVNAVDGNIKVIKNASTDTPTIIATLTVGANSSGIAITPNGNLLYITNSVLGVNGVTYVFQNASTDTPTLLTTLATGDFSSEVAVSQSGTFAYVGHSNAAVTIRVINNASTSPVILNSASTGSSPIHIATVNSGGHDWTYTANFASNDVTLIRDNLAQATVSVGNSPDFAVFSPDKTKLYVANSASASVTIIQNANTLTPTVLTTLTVGSTPTDIVFSPSGNFAYIANEGVSSVSVVQNASSLTPTILSTITVGTAPFFMAVTPNGDYVYVTDFGSDNVEVIQNANGLYPFITANYAMGKIVFNGTAWNV